MVRSVADSATKAQVKEALKGVPFVAVPQIYYDHWQPQLSPASQSIFQAIWRQTIGYQKFSDFISNSQFTTFTGIKSHHTIASGVQELESHHLVSTKTISRREPTLFTVNVSVVICREWQKTPDSDRQDLPSQYIEDSIQSGEEPTATVTQTTGYPDDSGIYDEWTFNSPNFDLAEAMSKRADSCKRTKPRKAEIYDAVAVAVRHGFDEALEYENE